jgi:hypothetical protein
MMKHARTAGIDHKEIHGLTFKTLYDDNQNIEVVIATGGGPIIVAVPLAAIHRDNSLGTDEADCLKKCTGIDDLEKRLNCILKCPVSKNYRVFIA